MGIKYLSNKRMERKKNLFDFFSKLLPGYKGYVVREEKRNTDKKLRDELSKRIENSKLEIIDLQQKLIKKNEISICQEWDLIRKLMDTLFSKIKYSVYGESSFFSEKQLKEEELNEIYGFDLKLIETVNLLCSEVELYIQNSISPMPVEKLIRNIENTLNDRTKYINNFK